MVVLDKDMFLGVVVNVGNECLEMGIAGDGNSLKWTLKEGSSALVCQVESFGVCVE